MHRRRFAAGAVAALTAFAALAFAPPEVTVSATANGDGTASVTGTAAFPGEGEQSIMENTFAAVTEHAGGDAADALGLQLVDARIEPVEEGLKFVWVVNNMPDEVPPEGVRYTWAFAAGGQTIQLQAKRSNLLSSTTAEDPVGHVQHAAGGEGWFQIRGACQEEYLGTPISGCYHLDFVEGGFDTEANEAWMILPFDPQDDLNRPYAPEFAPGAVLTEVQTASMSIAASAQAFVSNPQSSSYINGWDSYVIGEQVELGVGRDSRAPSNFETVVDVAPDGSFSGTVSGLGGSTDTVWARACEGFVCTEASATP